MTPVVGVGRRAVWLVALLLALGPGVAPAVPQWQAGPPTSSSPTTSSTRPAPSTTAAPAAGATTTTSVRTSPPTTSAQAVRQQQIAGEIRSLKDEVEEATAEEAALLGQIDESNLRRRALDAKVAGLNRQIGLVQAQVDAAQARLEELEGQRVAAEAGLQETRRQLLEARETLQRRAVAAYTQAPAGRYVTWLLRARSLREAQTVGVYVNAALRTQSEAVRRYEVLRTEVEERRDALDRARSEAAQQRAVVAAERAGLEEQRRSESALRQEASAVVAEQRIVLDQILSRKREFQAQIAALQRQSESLAALLRARQSTQAAPAVGSGVLAMPIPGAPITSRFGSRTHPVFGDTRMHNGIDLAASAGTAILAAADGVVVSSGTLGGYGTATVIDHGNTLATLYAHQSSTSVPPGGRVTRGQVVGRVGCTGLCTGPHLHFEVRKNGTPVDPMAYL